jgi:hypothetical protein
VETAGEDLDLLRLREFVVAGESLIELVNVVVERAVEAEMAQLS